MCNYKCLVCNSITTTIVSDIPNSGRGLPRLDYRTKEWDPAFTEYLKNLDKTKPVILCGDLNVAHNEIGLYLIFLNKSCINGIMPAILCVQINVVYNKK